jgi:hypothetical protein
MADVIGHRTAATAAIPDAQVILESSRGASHETAQVHSSGARHVPE